MERKITNWRKASASANGEACVEAGSMPGAVCVRDTMQDGLGPVLNIDPAAWTRFLAIIKLVRKHTGPRELGSRWPLCRGVVAKARATPTACPACHSVNSTWTRSRHEYKTALAGRAGLRGLCVVSRPAAAGWTRPGSAASRRRRTVGLAGSLQA